MLTFLLGWAVLSALLFVAFVGVLRRFAEWHHAYLGAGCIALGALTLLWSHPLGFACIVVGDVLLWDDGLQHMVQVVTHDATYEAPLHRLWYYFPLGRSRLAGAVNAWLDHLFGRHGG